MEEQTISSRFQKPEYQLVLKKPHRRYLLRGKEKPLCKPKATKRTYIALLSILVWLLGFVPLIFLLYRYPYTALGILIWAVFPLILPSLYFLNKREKEKKSIISISLMEFVSRSKNLHHVPKVHIRTIRHVLGFIFNINPALIYPDVSVDKWIWLSGTSRIPYVFELVLGTGNRLSISLTEQQVDSMINGICGIKRGSTVEEFIITLSEELHKKSVSNDYSMFKLNPAIDEHKGEILLRSIPGGLFLGVLFWCIWLRGNIESITKISSIVIFLFSVTIGILLTWYAKIPDMKRIRRRLEKTDSSWNLLEKLAVPGFIQNYLQNIMLALSPGQILTIRESEPMPVYTAPGPEKMPLFCELCSNLKKLADLEDRFYIEPVTKTLYSFKKDMDSQKKAYSAMITICDGIEDAYVSFTIVQSNSVDKI